MYAVIRSETFNKWLKRLKNEKAKQLILARFKRVRYGNLGSWKYLKNGIAEIKFDTGPGYRVYFSKQGEMIILLLCAGEKKSQIRDIKKAEKVLKDWELLNA